MLNLYTFNSDMRKFLKTITMLGAISVFLLYIMSRIYDYYNTDYATLYRYNQMPDNIQIANTGSSHGYYGFCYDTMPEVSTFNFAFSAQRLSGDYFLVSQFIEEFSEDSTLYITISYFSFYGDSDYEALQKSDRLYSILPPSKIPQFNIFRYLKVKYFSILSEENTIPEVFLNYKPDAFNYWWSKETNEIDAITTAEDAHYKHFSSDYYGGDINPEEIESLQLLIDLCREHGITPILVTTPYLKEYNDLIDADFLSEFHTIVKRFTDQGVAYYDYSNDSRFSNMYSWFLDADHLNREGAREFTRILIHETLGR